MMVVSSHRASVKVVNVIDWPVVGGAVTVVPPVMQQGDAVSCGG